MKFHEKIKTGIDWNLFISQVDLIHDDKPLYIPNFLPNPYNYVTWKNIEDYLNFSQGYFLIFDEIQGLKDPPLIDSLYNLKTQDKKYIHDHIIQGLSFSFQGHGMIHPYASALCSEINDRFFVNSDSQIIGSFKSSSKSFPIHLDSNPIFIFQSQGVIEWTLYDNKVTNLGGRNYINKSLNPDKLTNPKTYTLSPGDFLYVPERMYHKIKVKSPRLTLSINCFREDKGINLDKNYYEIKN
jgi:hypothetical protein